MSDRRKRSTLNRAHYSAAVDKFLSDENDAILGELTRHYQFALTDLQKNAWVSQIRILKESLPQLPESHVVFEYAIPRMGKRVDAVILYAGIVFVLEFKVGEHDYPAHAVEQALEYCIDLKNFHDQSHSKVVVPILVSTNAEPLPLNIESFPDGVYHTIKANSDNLVPYIMKFERTVDRQQPIDPNAWIKSVYKPTPTIIEAAQALYKGHSVQEISRSDSGTINLGVTSDAIARIIERSKQQNRKAICFITGVPGAGKTLAGLNIANERHNIDEGEHAVFLSGNGPLVKVLQEALARNEVAESKGTSGPLTKKWALAKTKAFIQNIHHFRDDALQTDEPPVERVAVFDEAQRAWTVDQTTTFMAQKKGISDFDMSEPEFLISVLNRHRNWAIIICLVGGGQEINTGEAGLPEWFATIGNHYPEWDVYVSDRLTDHEYTNGSDLYGSLEKEQLQVTNELHLSVSIRSFRSEKLSAFIKSFLEMNHHESSSLFEKLKSSYPLVVTRDLAAAKSWLRDHARGGESLGITASSGAYRLRPYGIHIKSPVDPVNWFLNSKSDVRSSGFLEDVATEFDIQGLELDWTCVAWDANLRIANGQWEFKCFRGTEWQAINDETRQKYLLNSYRVLLTRARQGMVVFIPEGDPADRTRRPEFYDPVYDYFLRCGLAEL